MRNFALLIATLFYFSAMAQDVTFEQITNEPVHGDTEGAIYQCYGELTNNFIEPVEVKYTRITKEFAYSGIVQGICTDINCYFVSLDTIYETIEPQTLHNVEIRWLVQNTNGSFHGEGFVQWEISIAETGEVIDTFENTFIYDERTTSTSTTEENKIIVSPNPASHDINIPIDNFDALTIYNVNGQEVLRLTQGNSGKLDISNLENGHFIGLIRKETETLHFRFVKI